MATNTVTITVANRLKTLIDSAISGLTYESVPPEVFDADPMQYTGLDYVIIGDILEGSHLYATMRAGRKNREEKYLQRLKIKTTRQGSESTDSRLAAFNIFNEIEDLIADDPNIGLTSIPTLRLEITNWEVNTVRELELQGWTVTMTIDILVQARLV